MADFTTPVLGDTYATFLQLLKDRDTDIAVMFDGTTTSGQPTGSKGWDNTNFKFIKWNGTAWVDLATTYGISVSKLGGFSAGNGSGAIPISNGTVNTNLNADKVDGADAGTSANNVLKLDASGRAPSSILPIGVVAAGTYKSVTVDVTGRVTAGSNPTTLAGYGITDAANLTGTGVSGTWGISITGNAATATAATTATKWLTARTITLSSGLRGSVSLNGSANVTLAGQLAFGAVNTTGPTDWNDPANLGAGFGTSLIMGNATNGPGPAVWFHNMLVEYSSKDGTGNMTQIAIPYTDGTVGMYMRSRSSGTWTAWREYISSATYNNYAPTKTGGGASGNWAISITGNAATATLATNAANAATATTLVNSATVAELYNNGYYRVNGSQGLYWQAYSIGLTATDSSWVRVSGGTAGFLNQAGVIRSDVGLQVGGAGSSFNAPASGNASCSGTFKSGGMVSGNGGAKGIGAITTTTSTATPTGGSPGDIVLIY